MRGVEWLATSGCVEVPIEPTVFFCPATSQRYLDSPMTKSASEFLSNSDNLVSSQLRPRKIPPSTVSKPVHLQSLLDVKCSRAAAWHRTPDECRTQHSKYQNHAGGRQVITTTALFYAPRSLKTIFRTAAPTGTVSRHLQQFYSFGTIPHLWRTDS